ncbi:hypothetical protein QTO34_004800 [Cnephaeus nilssonii]|uniref:Uncharacterized protein n=1 Tax=Cnephaeus nilssonii TaxID=3371016 RepID=A0AA40HPW1_CNENI|nr:hypothetical protein QTO34_004800 [Eptesicus nilssonii]
MGTGELNISKPSDLLATLLSDKITGKNLVMWPVKWKKMNSIHNFRQTSSTLLYSLPYRELLASSKIKRLKLVY